MFVSNENTLLFLGLVFLISGHWSIGFTLENNELPFAENQKYATNQSGNITSKLGTSLQINDFEPIVPHSAAITNMGIHKKINLINNTTNIKSKRLRQRCPLNRTSSKLINNKQGSRSRFLEVFQFVQFDHVACTSSSGLDGTCLHQLDCQSAGGTGMGDCADGYGICCVTRFLCDEQSAALMGWFNNPDFPAPSSERLSCVFTLDKASGDIKQMRLDFAIFELLPPSGGICQQDQFIVSGQNINNLVPILCGVNTGQHVYIEVGDVEGPIYFAVQAVSPDSRLFSIKITQLTQIHELAAPPGCLQYFKRPQGYLESYNYNDNSDIGIARVPSYLNNLNYAMCIDRESNTCGVTYSNEDEMQIVNYDSDGLPIVPPNQAGVEIYNCPSDWLLIAATRICGHRLNDGSVIQDFTLNARITDTNAGPIVVWFRSDEGYVGRGFKLHYQQIPCLYPGSN